MKNLSFRPAVRGLVVDSDQRILLVRLVYPHGAWWVLPGGGIASHEDSRQALRRELTEEIGLVTPDIGPLIWKRTHVFALQDSDGVEWDGQSEEVYLISVASFDPRPAFSLAELRAENIDEIRWWTRTEITQHTGSDSFAPRDLAQLLSALFDTDSPDLPFHIHQVD